MASTANGSAWLVYNNLKWVVAYFKALYHNSSGDIEGNHEVLQNSR